MRKLTLTLAIALPLLCSNGAHADMNTELNQFFGKLGFEGNVSNPHVWQNQLAGYASGGSLYMRTTTRTIQLMSLQVPSLNAGCGGIDAYLGAFSMINGEQLTRFVKSIMSNASGYFFDLALQTMVPQMKNAKDFLQKLASDINSMNMSSCQAAQGIIGGLVPRAEETSKKVCQDIAGESNMFSDWAASRQGCTTGGEHDKVVSKAKGSDVDRVLKSKNLVWEALLKNPLFTDNTLREFAMSLSGTIIFDDKGNIKDLVSLTTNDDLIKALLNGGSAKVYVCDTHSLCLNPSQKTLSIDAKQALMGQVSAVLATIMQQAIADIPLGTKEKGFVASTSVPVLRYLIDSTSLGVSNAVVHDLGGYIAHDILLQYINELLQQVTTMIATKNYPEPAMQPLRERLAEATTKLGLMQSRIQVNQNALVVVDRQMNYQRQQLSGKLLTTYAGLNRPVGAAR